jgi:hypothetical protein
MTAAPTIEAWFELTFVDVTFGEETNPWEFETGAEDLTPALCSWVGKKRVGGAYSDIKWNLR